ncbi:hypothetical protein Nepgr_015915 [Nepenthes gracilis]|uniref:Uncharacterized protein n=1 Tax=Nepenthes gracilis TaxID=150966 RepID=A0AAD3SNL9_NEPGR|nr:hypothetical protein Nepgr_015915 [Nepenthes gracilis]
MSTAVGTSRHTRATEPIEDSLGAVPGSGREKRADFSPGGISYGSISIAWGQIWARENLAKQSADIGYLRGLLANNRADGILRDRFRGPRGAQRSRTSANRKRGKINARQGRGMGGRGENKKPISISYAPSGPAMPTMAASKPY